ncbi:hypothetical protein ZOSMA_18G01130 [Zostera marina]|uniref:Protein N-lysine methyltransferase METTL21A n=1 Tax=Zostera marina TaxID=29655 RepID=A0A0K9PS00_ZOSMR|nr:hypothetical protein ZOSMA_18G01130 [Zostera marina]
MTSSPSLGYTESGPSGGGRGGSGDNDDDDIVCLESFFVNRNYEVSTFTFGSHVIPLFCLQSASTDYDLTGQLVWPGAILMNNYLSKNAEILQGHSVIELGSGVGITGILCSRFCNEVVLTDHNDEVLEILNKNIELQRSSGTIVSAGLNAEKLEWGNHCHLDQIKQKYSNGFDIILGADICFQQSSIPPLFYTVTKLLHSIQCHESKFILAYVSRSKSMDAMVMSEAHKHGMKINEISGTRTIISNLFGVVYEITLN